MAWTCCCRGSNSCSGATTDHGLGARIRPVAGSRKGGIGEVYRPGTPASIALAKPLSHAALLWHYRYGKPKDQVDVSVSVAVAAEVLADRLTVDELKTLHRRQRLLGCSWWW